MVLQGVRYLRWISILGWHESRKKRSWQREERGLRRNRKQLCTKVEIFWFDVSCSLSNLWRNVVLFCFAISPNWPASQICEPKFYFCERLYRNSDLNHVVIHPFVAISWWLSLNFHRELFEKYLLFFSFLLACMYLIENFFLANRHYFKRIQSSIVTVVARINNNSVGIRSIKLLALLSYYQKQRVLIEKLWIINPNC